MSDDLQELGERIKWARSEIEVLARDVNTFMDQHIQVFVRTMPGRSNDMILQMSGEVPVHVRARSGTIANELRACLDGLASELAVRNGRTAAGVYFPIAYAESAFDSDGMKEKIRKLRPEDREAIRAWRPFAVGKDDTEGNVLLWGLHQADIKRKHHRLVATSTGGALTLKSGRVGSLNFIDRKLVQGQNKIAEVSKDTNATFEFQPTFRYVEPDMLRGRPVIETLHEFADLVEAIVSSFKAN